MRNCDAGGWRQQQQRLSQGDKDQQDGSYQQAAEPLQRKLADDGAGHIDGPVFMTRIRQLAASIAGDMQGNGRRRTIQTQMQMRPAELRQKHRSTKERK